MAASPGPNSNGVGFGTRAGEPPMAPSATVDVRAERANHCCTAVGMPAWGHNLGSSPCGCAMFHPRPKEPTAPTVASCHLKNSSLRVHEASRQSRNRTRLVIVAAYLCMAHV
jgi:hypothetical protein